MVFSFSRPASLDTAIDAYLHARKLLAFAAYRSNIHFDSIDCFVRDENGFRVNKAEIRFASDCEAETSEHAGNRIISCELIGYRTGKLLTAIKNGGLVVHQACSNIDARRHYSYGRAITILAQFEREFRLLHGDVIDRSDEYNEVRGDVLEALQHLKKSQPSKRRKRYVQEYVRGIQKKETREPYGARLERALESSLAVMSPLARKLYRRDLKEMIPELSERIAKLRNDLAHSNIDFDFQPIHLTDLKLVEMLIYAMRLQSIGMDERKCRIAIGKLFGLNA